MKIVLLVLLILVVLCVLIGSVRVGGIVEYSEEGVLALLRLGLFKIQLYPPKPEKPSEKKAKKKKADKKGKKKQKTAPKPQPSKAKSEPSKRGGQLALLKELLPLGIEALGTFTRKIRIDELTLHYTIGGRSDPAGAAIWYGRLCAGGGAVAALIENHFTVKKRRLSVWVDFTLEQALIYVKASLSLTVGQLVRMGVYYGWKALRIYLRQRKQTQSQEVKNNGKETSDQ